MVPERSLPHALMVALKLFRRVQEGLIKGDFVADQAEYGLRRLERVTSRGRRVRVEFADIAQELGLFIEALNKVGTPVVPRAPSP